MEEMIEFLFGNRFFELPFLEALSYIAAALLIGAAIVGLVRRLMGYSPQPAETTTYRQPTYSESYEWRKAA
jgi:hypothetical protein